MTNRLFESAAAPTVASITVAATTTATNSECFTNTAKLPIETVKRLIGAVASRPHLWIRNLNGQKRGDICMLWYQVSQEVHLPADICRIKWGHLRDNFRKVFIRNTFSDETPTTWRFYNDMKFMEKTVAENVMRQKSITDQYRPWPGLEPDRFYHQISKMIHTTPQYRIPICEPKESYERNMQHPYNLTDISTYFDDAPHKKRIKIEAEEQQHNEEEFQSSCSIESKHNISLNNNESSREYAYHDAIHNAFPPQPDIEEDDDDFDEDAVTEEDNEQKNTNDIFTVEVFDDDDDDVHDIKDNIVGPTKNAELLDNNASSHKSAEKGKMGSASKLPKIHSSTSTDMRKVLQLEKNSDRMFLLSLLPFLEKVDENRKLHVRQKLQNVLIDEFG